MGKAIAMLLLWGTRRRRDHQKLKKGLDFLEQMCYNDQGWR